MNVSPLPLTSRAPSPRSASEIRNRGASAFFKRRRMKLDELEIGDAGAGVVRQRDAVAGRHRRIGRLAEDLAGAAGGQQHGWRRRQTPRARLIEKPDAGNAARPRRTGRSPARD